MLINGDSVHVGAKRSAVWLVFREEEPDEFKPQLASAELQSCSVQLNDVASMG